MNNEIGELTVERAREIMEEMQHLIDEQGAMLSVVCVAMELIMRDRKEAIIIPKTEVGYNVKRYMSRKNSDDGKYVILNAATEDRVDIYPVPVNLEFSAIGNVPEDKTLAH